MAFAVLFRAALRRFGNVGAQLLDERAVMGGTRAEFAAFIESEIAKWGKAVKESGAKAE